MLPSTAPRTLPTLVAVLAVIAVMANSATAASADGSADDAPGAPVSIAGLAGFEEPRRVLGSLLTSRRGPVRHSFCVVGYRHGTPAATTAWVHWRQGKRLVLWEPAAPGQQADLARSRRSLDLTKDVVDTPEQLKGSSYLVTRAWVTQVLDDCARVGQVFQVNRSR